MANSINSINFLPEYLQTDKNAKFLSSTLDQWIRSPQLERIDGYIGSKLTPNYNSISDVYIPESSTIRNDYQLTPALIINDALFNPQDVISLDDLVNELSLQGADVSNLDRLFRSKFYSYDPYIDWDKLINYQDYYWLVMGPDSIEVTETETQIVNDILNHKSYTNTSTGLTLTNGLKLRFISPEAGTYYQNDYFIEGVGSDTGIQLVNFQDLRTPENIAGTFNENFDASSFDLYEFDNIKKLPLRPEYVTINRASQDLNSWSRYNRWVHSEVIRVTAEYKNQIPLYPFEFRAQRPIIEFRSNLKLYNHGTKGIPNVDFIDTVTIDPFLINGDIGYYIDQTLVEKGNRIIFNSASTVEERATIYRVDFVQDFLRNTLITGTVIQLVADTIANTGSSVTIDLGLEQGGTDWWFDGNIWQKSQQHTEINQAPLFDLFTDTGISYADKTSLNFTSNFSGNKIFGYSIGTGIADTVLGFPLKYRNNVEQGDYLFSNYFMTDVISITAGTQYVTNISSAITYFKIFNNDSELDRYSNVWTTNTHYQIPILQFQTVTTSTSSLTITALDSPTAQTFTVDAYVNNQKLSTTRSTNKNNCFINFSNTLTVNSNVLLKIYTDAPVNGNGYYETPLGLTNNPLNSAILDFTLSELGDHVSTMVQRSPDFVGEFPGISNIRNLPNISEYGSRLISNSNPIAFSQMFIGKKEHSVINAIDLISYQYLQFKNQIIFQLNQIVDQQDPISTLDLVLAVINRDKTVRSPYYLSDMLAYGTDKTVRSYTVTNPAIISYQLDSIFDSTALSLRSILIYLNGDQLVLNRDYTFDTNDPYVTFNLALTTGDTITIVDYPDTSGSYVPPTPSKLGLYPAYQPKKYLDDTYTVPQIVIQGHDGSITIAYNDFRDDVLLEFEKRVYNNIKTVYQEKLFDINSIFPGAFRNTEYSRDEINLILESDFSRWSGFNGIDYTTNTVFDSNNPFTWNYSGGYVQSLGEPVFGYWRSVFKYLYDTDRPHTCPWEMLGFNEEPSWWASEYGAAPYTSGNTALWLDIQSGFIRNGSREGIDLFYARPGLIGKGLIPVDHLGNLVTLSDSIVNDITPFTRRQNWKFGDQAPAETAWRRSSQWPFAVQRLLALTKPVDYASFMYDPSRVILNHAGQWIYKSNERFFNLTNLAIHSENGTLTSGYSVLVSEIGQQRTQNYIKKLRNDLAYINFNLFYKVGGFASKNTLQITIDAYEPDSNSPGSLLPREDFNLILNVSNPIKSVGISGIVIQKSETGNYIIKGYDTQSPYFTVYSPIRSVTTPSINVGGVSEPYVIWTNNNSSGDNNLSSIDTTTAETVSGLFYQAGQIVSYSGKYYRVLISHRGEDKFNPSYYQSLPALPISGGVTAITANKFDGIPIKILYNTEFRSIQEVYDIIIGYGAWLEDQGFIFDEYNSTINDVINWEFAGKEFLYWTTQNWATNNVITLSPFADKIKYSYPQSVVNNLFDPFYGYSFLSANGLTFPKTNLAINRGDGVCTISSTTSTDGIYYAKINSIQKEHAIVFNNTTIFNDVVYDIETGYQQQRMKLSGFRTKDWNGNISSPGFVYDDVYPIDWKPYTYYQSASVVIYNGKYYSALGNIESSATFDFTQWFALDSEPIAGLLPNFNYKINQFQDFYSLDIDNFDAGQQKMAQHLIGYTPRTYLNNIFTNPVAQYKFYQGFIKEKGTRNAIEKLSKASIQNLQGQIDFTEEWAFRIGAYGSYTSYRELETILVEGSFLENPQVINYVRVNPKLNDLIYYSTSGNWTIVPDNYDPSKTFYVSTGTYLNNNYILSTAGYARIDDVTFTAFSENSLLTIINNSTINAGDTAWLGFKQNGDWDVLRYTLLSSSIISSEVSIPGLEITFTTNNAHRLTAGEIISITQYTDQLNGIYLISNIPAQDKFSIQSAEVYIDQTVIPGPGQLFKFVSARADTFDNIPTDDLLLQLTKGSLIWVDSDREDGNGSWAVYSKIQNYYPTTVPSGVGPNYKNEQIGYSISRVGSDNLFLIGSPGETSGYGGITAYLKANGTTPALFKFFLNEDNYRPYYNSEASNITNFGQSVAYDDYVFPGTNNGLMFVGAPMTSAVKTIYNTSITGTVVINTVTTIEVGVGINFALTTATASTFVEQGLVTISSIDPVSNEETRLLTLVSPNPTKYEHFGSSLYVQLNTSSKFLLVGAPGKTNSIGSVYAFNITGYSTGTTSTLIISTATNLIPSDSTKGMQWGYSISGSDDGSVVAIGAPGYNDKTGLVNIFRNNGTYLQQVIEPPAEFGIGSEFGSSVKISPDGSYLFVSAPNIYSYTDNNKSYGQVLIYQSVNGQFNTSTVQILKNPLVDSKMKFGHDISVNPANDILIISALGINSISTLFDEYQTRNIGGKSVVSIIETITDAGTTGYYTDVDHSGTVYVYNRRHNRFVLSEELSPLNPLAGTDHGYSINIDRDNNVYVGAPAIHNQGESAFYFYNSTSTNSFSWEKLRYQEDMVNIDTVQKITLIDTFNDKILNYLETIDPAKGKISGLADREIKFKSLTDPAVYVIGSTGTVVNPSITWTEEHLGDLWWDLSTVKYLWYEQGELEYRKNNWGKIFPGSTIDVYEWVGSYLLPSQWSAQADTSVGLTQGISGQPKFIDDSTMSVKQIYNPVSDSFTNYYFFWVKNKKIVPDNISRKISSYQVATIIGDPVAQGLQFATPISADSIALSNIPPIPVGSNVTINISTDLNINNIPKHTEWLLLKENDSTSMPGSLLEKKLIDSLIGHDNVGNLVPDPNLSPRQAYGIEIRPRQSMFVDRFQALRNLLDFANGILINNPITGNYSFKNLKTQEIKPDIYSHVWDQEIPSITSVSDLAGLIEVDLRKLTPATVALLTATVYNGQVISVEIVNPGYGYMISPKVTVVGKSITPTIITTEIDSNGQIVSYTIEDPGSGYSQAPELNVRPWTVLIGNDNSSGGKWALYVWDAYNTRWSKIHTQTYNTELYWSYVDYASENYNQYKLIDFKIDSTYELATLTDIQQGQYIKIKNIGDGRSAIITPAIPGSYGSFSNGYDLIWSQNGTIQLSESLWNVPASELGFDEYNNFDETLYNQAPDIELEYILTSLKDDIFIDELKINWNLFFFTAVKYCLFEQKLLDWAFKTTFINVINFAGSLDQRPVYKITTSTYFEDYIKEIKPYHTQIRNFTTNHSVLEPENSYNTDFDSPSYYNTLDNQFEIVDVGNTLTNVYPWKSWSDNYSYSVSSISINNPGMGYTQVPTLIISKPDLSNGVTATAVAYVASNKVSLVRIINSGTGYTKTPTVSISGGGLVTTTATFYAQLGNNNIRKNAVTIKFDRISTVDQIGDIQVTDQFVCNGSQNEFVLNWLTQPDKQKINITLDSNLVLISDYTVVYYTKLFNGYNKQYSKIVFLNYIPKFDQILTVIYEKNVELMTGIERLSHFTKLTDFSTVTSGLVYPQTTLKGVPFGHTSAWSEPYPNYDTFTWDDDVSNYTTAIVTANSNDTGFSPRGPLPGGTSVKVQSTKGISLYQYANVISHSVPRFNTSTLMVMDVSTDTVWLNAQVLPGDDLVPGDVIEFWNNDSNFSVLDSIVQGGSWSTSTNSSIMNIIGIDPNDVSHDTTTGLYYLGGIDTSNVIVDGDGYYTENTGYTPEELISGTATDSLGINVYTKDLIGAPTIYSSSVPILPGIRTIIPLKLLPPNADSITVNFNNILFTYDPNTDTSEPNNFSIDWINSNLIIPSQSVGGLLGYTIITIGGNEYIDTEYLTVKGYTSLQISSLAAVTTVKSVYVSLNGIGLSTATSIISPYYSFGPVSQDNRRASVKIYNLTTTTLYEAQAWFFASPYKHFNEIREQSFIISSVSTPNNLTLSQSPGTLGPPEANIVVEVVNSKGTSILQSPDIKYYEISDPAQTFPVPTQYIYTTVSSTTNAGESTIPISSTANIRLYSLITNQSNISSVATNTNVVAIGVDTITLSAPTLKTFNSGDILKFQLNTDQNFKVYRNGLELDFGFDYYFEVDNQLLGFIPGSVYTGDVIAIVSHVGGPLYDYYVDGDQLIIVANTPNITEFPSTIRAITYTNQDSMLIRKDTLDGNASGRYCMSRAVTNDNYVWVSVDGTSLINKVDFVVLEDQVTVQLSQQFADVSVQRVTITSLSSSPLATNVLGYRISIDMFNNTQFKRLSAQNTTYLTQPLRFNDTEIYVADAGVLSQPLVSKKIPGVVIIAGERIEFFRMTNNTLSQLRRSTLGTSPNFYSGINTKVIDQGIGQTIPYAEKIYKQSYLNLGTNNVYVISKTPQSIYYEKAMIAVSNTTTAVLQSKTYYNNLDYVQVNVNGQPIDQTTSTYTVISNLGGGN